MRPSKLEHDSKASFPYNSWLAVASTQTKLRTMMTQARTAFFWA